mgnify:CR=1 FL=1
MKLSQKLKMYDKFISSIIVTISPTNDLVAAECPTVVTERDWRQSLWVNTRAIADWDGNESLIRDPVLGPSPTSTIPVRP